VIELPLPEPREEGHRNETKEEFISRCASSDAMQREFDTREEILGVCYSKWRRRNKEGD